MMAARQPRAVHVSAGESGIMGANIRVLRQRNSGSQARLGELMGWPTTSTVCAAEGHRGDRQRRFTIDEVQRLAAIFAVPPWKLTTRCANCEGHPPTGFACLACGATSNSEHPPTTADSPATQAGHR
jgi:hypothetical protein